VFTLRALFDDVSREILSGSTNEELRVAFSVYSRWTKALGSQGELFHFLNILLSRLDWNSFDARLFADMIATASRLRLSSPEIDFALREFENRLHEFDFGPDSSELIVQSIIGLYKYGSESRSSFELLFSKIGPAKIASCKLAQVISIHIRLFSLVNPVRINELSFGQSSIDVLPVLEPALLKNIPKMSIREIARMMDSLAIARKGSPELWLSLITVLGQLVGEEGPLSMSPEEVCGVAFALAEMNFSIPEELKNQLVVSVLERIHLLKDFNSVLFFLTMFPNREVLCQILELMDTTSIIESIDPGIVLMNLSLRLLGPLPEMAEIIAETNHDVELYMRTCQSVIDDRVFIDIANFLGPNAEFNQNLVKDGLLIDFFSPERKIAVLVSSPVHLVGNRPTGIGILRHRAVEQAFPPDVVVCNISALEWVNGDKGQKEKIIEDILNTQILKSENAMEVDLNESPEVNNNSDAIPLTEMDLSPYLRKDRNAAHRTRAPPNDSLPWIPSVLTLKNSRTHKKSRRFRIEKLV
jgi:hypothetical protein